ncbi:MAG TPA: DUF4258 domain-containing protein [Candidatus Nanoarchaeia archaeon]|nr:DUF4258 domain-containing protein [Candidatus Nanoarchaeia archaeon]
MRLELTRHAKEKMVIHGISKEQVIKAIKQGAKFQQTDGFLVKYSYLRVAYTKRGDTYRIKTVFIE